MQYRTTLRLKYTFCIVIFVFFSVGKLFTSGPFERRLTGSYGMRMTLVTDTNDILALTTRCDGCEDICYNVSVSSHFPSYMLSTLNIRLPWDMCNPAITGAGQSYLLRYTGGFFEIFSGDSLDVYLLSKAIGITCLSVDVQSRRHVFVL